LVLARDFVLFFTSTDNDAGSAGRHEDDLFVLTRTRGGRSPAAEVPDDADGGRFAL
jgi:hypothetical protein